MVNTVLQYEHRGVHYKRFSVLFAGVILAAKNDGMLPGKDDSFMVERI